MSKKRLNINYYEVFGIPPTATSEDISTAHKALAKMYHPDINNREDAHEKMTMLNEANDILSDNKKREKYDNELKQHQKQNQNPEKPSSQPVEKKQARTSADTQERTGKAELLRRKAEERLKRVEIAQKRRAEQAQKKAEEAAQKNKQRKIDFDRQEVINDLSALVMDDTTKRRKNVDVDEERYYATKVLLSMVRRDDNRLQKMTEEAERKQRIDEILTLVKEINEKKDEWV
ncbi:MAG: DnaJ domain-containing protein [Oscillospiraceae bacterium]|nr:DnaJ domain-containing protein [Oscillospiraceae bacterium]